LPVGLNPLMDGVGIMLTKAGNANACAYEAATGTFMNAGTGNAIAFMSSGAVALTASTTYVWNYICAGNKLGS
jgi:NADH:ubiquinone oxidoreductase subunit 5 (subunit L)/multisubunit Na+/H+ antiporter MnhA subunit